MKVAVPNGTSVEIKVIKFENLKMINSNIAQLSFPHYKHLNLQNQIFRIFHDRIIFHPRFSLAWSGGISRLGLA